MDGNRNHIRFTYHHHRAASARQLRNRPAVIHNAQEEAENHRKLLNVSEMNKAEIIEQSEGIVTVRTDRGDEYVFDLDETVKAVAMLLSDRRNEQRMGWTLNVGWFEQELRLLSERSRPKHGIVR